MKNTLASSFYGYMTCLYAGILSNNCLHVRIRSSANSDGIWGWFEDMKILEKWNDYLISVIKMGNIKQNQNVMELYDATTQLNALPFSILINNCII